jgi:hypothetical protein
MIRNIKSFWMLGKFIKAKKIRKPAETFGFVSLDRIQTEATA